MKHRNIIVLIVAIVLVFLLIYPTVYMQAEGGKYLKNIEEIKDALQKRDAALAMEKSAEKLSKWDGNNIWILAFTPHAETEFIKDSIIELNHSIGQKDYTLALERTDIIYSKIDHLMQASRLSVENLF